MAVGLIDFNPSVQRFHVERVRAYLDMAYEFEARNLLLVLGEYIWQQEVIPPAEQWATAVKHVRTLGEYAAELGLEIALELEPFQLSLLERRAEHGAVPGRRGPSRGEGQPRHLAPGAGPSAAFVDRGTSRDALLMFISPIATARSTATCRPGRGVVDFPPYLEAIKRLGIDDATISVELEYSPDPDHIVEWVAEAYEKTAALMRAAGLRA